MTQRRTPLDWFSRVPPWRPTASIWVTVFLLPLAGGLVTTINLLRMRQVGKAVFALVTGLLSLLFLLVVRTVGDDLDTYVSISYVVITLGDIGLFAYLQRDDFAAWSKAHPRQEPGSGWGAAAWAMLGFAAMLAIVFAWAVLLVILALAGIGPAILPAATGG